MKFATKLSQGTLIKRYKRFLADIELNSGECLTIHCPNTGSMRNCMEEGGSIWFSESANKKRKYPHTWELSTTPAGDIAGVNTGRANALVREAMEAGKIPFLKQIKSIRAEVPYGQERSRIDFVVELEGDDYYIEVKSVTLCEGAGQGYFPDSISARGAKHLRELSALCKSGKKAALIYCVQHTGIQQVAPARHIDSEYCRAFDEAIKSGVKVFAMKAEITVNEIVLECELPVVYS